MQIINGPTGGSKTGIAGYPGVKLNLIVAIIPETGGTLGNNFSSGLPPYIFKYPYGSWCPGCAEPQDIVTCSEWPGDSNAPTCGPGKPSPNTTPCPTADVNAGVWNVQTCHLTGTTASNNCKDTNYTDFSGYPVLYEKPIMTAYQDFVDTVLKHYSPSGSGNGPTIAKYIGYIRVGMANGGEALPLCTQAQINATTYGVWPSPAGLSSDSASGIYDWYATTPNCTTDASCQGKWAYITGSPNGVQADGPGYIKAMYAAFITSLARYHATDSVQLMANAHAGPPSSSDLSYADLEAPIYMGIGQQQPFGGGYNGRSGFGQESLSEYDLAYNPQNPNLFHCEDDWCSLFSQYAQYGGNFYLQSTVPNNAAAVQITSIVTSGATQIVTCQNPCTNTNNLPTGPGQPLLGLYAQEGFALTTGSGPAKTTYKIATEVLNSQGVPIQGILNSTQFTCDTTTPCKPNSQIQTLYVGDFIPDTIPFAHSASTTTLEIYFCDWEFAFNNANAASAGCQSSDPTNGQLYFTVLNNP